MGEYVDALYIFPPTAKVSKREVFGWPTYRKGVPVLWSEGCPRIKTAALVQVRLSEELCMCVLGETPEPCYYEWFPQIILLRESSPEEMGKHEISNLILFYLGILKDSQRTAVVNKKQFQFKVEM